MATALDLNGQSGGTGFGTASWVDLSQTAKVFPSGLSFPTLSTSGNAATVSGSGFLAATRDLAVAPITNSNGEFWFSFLIQRNQNTQVWPFKDNEYAGITFGGALTDTNTRIFIGAATVGSGSSTDIRDTAGTNGAPPTDIATSTIPVADSTSHDVTLIVAKVTVSTSTTVDVFINPTNLGRGRPWPCNLGETCRPSRSAGFFYESSGYPSRSMRSPQRSRIFDLSSGVN